MEINEAVVTACHHYDSGLVHLPPGGRHRTESIKAVDITRHYYDGNISCPRQYCFIGPLRGQELRENVEAKSTACISLRQGSYFVVPRRRAGGSE